MSRVRVLAASLLVLLALATPAHAATPSIERATGAVVPMIAGASRIGSGVVVARDRVLTAAHVVDGAAGRPASILIGDRLVGFEVIAIDRRRDLALLAVNLDGARPVVWGDSGSLVRGEDVIAIGFPIGFREVSLTKGVVSSPVQTFQGSVFVQTDAAINPGNSGGALVDGEGRLVGVNVAKIAQIEVDAVGFAVPAADALEFVRTAEPGIELAFDTSGTYAALRQIAILAMVVAAAGAVVWYARRRRLATVADEADAAAKRRPRAVFHIIGAAATELRDIRLPAVAGTAPNADLPVRGEGVAAYHARFTFEPGGVRVVDLTDGAGVYCGDRCVKAATIKPGETVRIGESTIVLERSYEG